MAFMMREHFFLILLLLFLAEVNHNSPEIIKKMVEHLALSPNQVLSKELICNMGR